MLFEIELNLISQSFAAQTAWLNPKHPLRIRTKNILAKAEARTAESKFSRIILALPKAEYINPIAFLPWRNKESHIITETWIGGPFGRSKEQATKDFERFISTIPKSDLQVFSDDSKSEALDGAIGGGLVIYQYNLQVDRQTFSLDCNTEVFDTEATVALKGTQATIQLPSTRFATDLWVFLDNLKVAMRLGFHSTGSSQSVFEEFCELTTAWPLRPRLPHTRPGSIRIRWIPEHLDIPRNETVDKTAKEGAILPSLSDPICTLAFLKRSTKTNTKSAKAKL